MYQSLILGNVVLHKQRQKVTLQYQSLILGNVGMVTVDQNYKDTEDQSLILGNVERPIVFNAIITPTSCIVNKRLP